MKPILKDIKQWFLIGISFLGTILVVWGWVYAYSWIVQSNVSSWDTLTVAKWNDMVNDLNYLKEAVGAWPSALSAYPVGSIYISTSSTSPATSIGGTWSSFWGGSFLMGVGGGFSAGATGWSKDAVVVSHSHTTNSTSTVTDPWHSHSLALRNGSGGPNPGIGGLGFDTNNHRWTETIKLGTTWISVSTATVVNNQGVSATNANLPPYIVVYMWTRTG
jgi:hypothetical protein